MKSLREMLRHVKSGGCLLVFPAGRVAFWQDGQIKDPPWNDHLVTLMSRMKATVVPVWFFGGVPAWMQVVGKISSFLRTAFIPRGLVELSGQEIVGRVGSSFSTELLKKKEKGWLRKHLEGLRDLGN
jgi:putative hemolysin